MNITAVNSYTKKISFDLANIRKVGIFLSDMKTVKQWYDLQTDKPTLVCNCGLFTWNNNTKKYEPCYSLKIDNKVLIQDSLYRGVGIKGTKLSIGTIQDLDCEDFVSGAPVIIENGQNKITQAWIDELKTIAGKEPRTILGWNDNSLSLICVDGRQTGKLGIDMASMPKLCLDNGLTNAVNFDGGGSSMTVVNGTVINSPSEQRGVYTVFALWEEQTMTEWKAPDFNLMSAKYAQVDKDGNIKYQNNVYEYAEGNAKANGYAVWEKSTKKMVYPIIPIQIVPEIEDNPFIDYAKVKELTDKLATQITYLNGIVSQIQDTLREIE